MTASEQWPRQDVERELTRAQMLLWAGQCLQPDDPLYNMAIVFRIRGALDTERFRVAFESLVACTDSLRAVIVGDDDDPRQCFPAGATSRLEMLDFTGAATPAARLLEWAAKRCMQTLNLRESCYDSALLRLAVDDHAWYLNQHHLYTDAWSKAVLFKRLGELYASADAGRPAALPTPPQFETVVQDEHCEREAARRARAAAYWRSRPSPPAAASRFYGPTPATRSGRTERVALELGAKRSARLRALASTPGYRALTDELALFRIFATVLSSLLHRLGGQQELAIGTPSLNRPSPARKDTAGLFIELFPLRVQIGEHDSFRTLFDKIARESHALLRNAVSGSCPAEQGRSYDVVLNYITASFGEFAGLAMESQWIHPEHGDRAHLLRLQVHDFDRRAAFSLFFDVNEDCFAARERDWLKEHFTRLLDAFVENAEQRIASVALLDHQQQAAEAAALRGRRCAPEAGTVSDRLREQARRRPHAAALVAGGDPGGAAAQPRPPAPGRSIDYQELDRTADRIAAGLNSRGIGGGSAVAIALPRSLDAVLAILGVMRSGAAYVPIDPRHPPRRIAYLLADCAARLVIGASEEHPTGAVDGPPWVSIEQLLQGPPPAQAPPGPGSEDLAYILYTSGSTGNPKGVAVAHASLANYIAWAARRYCGDDTPAFPLFTPLTFDLTVTSLFLPLTVGGTLVVYEEPAQAREITVRRVVADNRVEVVKLTPAHLALIDDMDFHASRIRVLVVGGEDFKTALARNVHRRLCARALIYNEYGPTEATVACMIHRYRPERDNGASVPIGGAIDNLEIYLLGADGRPVPRGTVGEITIGGAGVARGYLADLRRAPADAPAFQPPRFVANPFRPGEQMYRSGDRGFRDRRGVVHYLGRSDTQLKVRGVRIESAEVEAALLAHPDIDECVVDRVGGEHGDNTAFCRQCGLDGRHPEADIDDDGVCRLCRGFAADQNPARAYFGDNAQLLRIVARIRDHAGAAPHCVMLLSGGKDSSYALCRIVEMGLTPLVFTLDNGYISDGAKANIRRVVDKLGLELVVGSTPAMREIFRDSLERFSNVCNGCFKTIYTMSMKLARERGIRHIVTGLSRGQIFETRMSGLFQQAVTDPGTIDRTIIEARKAYHRMDDAVSRCLDVSMFDDDAVFEQIEFIDFYRYSDASLDDILSYLEHEAAWIRPADTGRSTNCLINEAGIHVHKTERGYHNYALPYSWDVRLGHKERDAARRELDDSIDLTRVERILDEVGYRPLAGAGRGAGEERLAAWFVSRSPPSTATLRAWLCARLPAEFVPSHFVAVDALPLTPNAKVDRSALPHPRSAAMGRAPPPASPAGTVEQTLAALWAEVLGLETVGVHENFFELGGDSILCIQIVARARAAGLAITPQQVFDQPTVAGLAVAANARTRVRAEQGRVRGTTPVTPIQQRFFDQHRGDTDRHAQYALITLPPTASAAAVQMAVSALVEHHDTLQSRFSRDAQGHWMQHFGGQTRAPALTETEATAAQAAEIAGAMLADMDIGAGRLLHSALLPATEDAALLLLAIHPLVVDGLSWWVLLEDLQTSLQSGIRARDTGLPLKTTSYLQWAQALRRHARSPRVLRQSAFWSRQTGSTAFPCGRSPAGDAGARDRGQVLVRLDGEQTRRLLLEAGTALRAQVPDLLVSALLEASHAHGGGDELGITLETHGREEVETGVDLLRTVGAMTCTFPLWLRRPRAAQPLQTLRAVKEQLAKIPDRGIGHGLLQTVATDARTRHALAGQPSPPLLLSYMGNWDRTAQDPAHARFVRPVRRLGATGQASAAMEVEAVVFDGVLEVGFEYRESLCDGTAVAEFAQTFQHALVALVDAADLAAPTALAPSDFPNADIAQDELDDILSEFGEGG